MRNYRNLSIKLVIILLIFSLVLFVTLKLVNNSVNDKKTQPRSEKLTEIYSKLIEENQSLLKGYKKFYATRSNGRVERKTLGDLNSKHVCVDALSRETFCEAKHVCVSPKIGVFLVMNDDEASHVNGSSSKGKGSSSGGLKFYSRMLGAIESNISYVTDSMANLVSAEHFNDRYYKPTLLFPSDLRFNDDGGSLGNDEYARDESLLGPETPIIYHPRHILSVGGAYSPSHYSHFLFNLIIPLWHILFTPSISPALNKVLNWRENHLKIPLSFRDIYFSPRDLILKRGFDFTLLFTGTPLTQMSFNVSTFIRSVFLFPLNRLDYFDGGDNVFEATDPGNNNQDNIFGQGFHQSFDSHQIHCYERGTFGLANTCGVCNRKINFEGYKVFRWSVYQHFKASSFDPFYYEAFRKTFDLSASSSFARNETLVEDYLEHHFDPEIPWLNPLVLPHLRMELLLTRIPIRVTLVQRLKTRIILNINETVHFLQTRYRGIIDLQVISLESSTLEEQVNLFSKTDLVMAVHGNSLGNCVFLPSWAGVLEIFQPLWETSFFTTIIRSLKLAYYSYRCDETDLCSTYDQRTINPKNRNALINFRILGSILDFAVQEISKRKWLYYRHWAKEKGGGEGDLNDFE